jgi:WD40 repeat protein
MNKLKVFIEAKAFASVRLMEVFADVPISELIPLLVEALQLPHTDLFGNRLVYVLRRGTEGTPLPGSQTLGACDIRPGTRLVLESYVIDEPTLSLMPSDRQTRQLDALPTIAGATTVPEQDQADTSIPVPAITSWRARTASRRTFLMLAGAAVGVGGVALGIAGYRALYMGQQPHRVQKIGTPVARQVTVPRQVTQVKASLPSTARAALTFTQHRQTVRTVGWSPNGTQLASGADDSRLLIWGTNGTVHHNIAHPAPVLTLAWSPDGQRIVTGAGGQIAFFNVQSARALARSFDSRQGGIVTSVAWTPHGQMQMACGTTDMRALVWNTTTYTVQTTFSLHTAPVEAVSWSADGRTVASSSLGGVVRVWNAATAKEVHGLYYTGGTALRRLAFAPTGMLLATGGDDGKVRLWNGLTCQRQAMGDYGEQCMDVPQILQVSSQAILALAWSPDARFLAVGANDGSLSLWYPASSQQPLFKIQQGAAVQSLAWSPHGNMLAGAVGNDVIIWSIM